ncbi:MAG: PLP-dependent transferase [Acidobacteriota bacterium]
MPPRDPDPLPAPGRKPEAPEPSSDLRFETAAIHGAAIEESTGSVAPPLYLSTTYRRDPHGELEGDYSYSRAQNPNAAALEGALATLEGGSEALVFASGLAALAAIFQALGPGQRVIAPRDLYHGTRHYLDQHMRRWGLEVRFVSMTDLAEVEAAAAPAASLMLIETPSNPLLHTTDIAAVAEVGRRAGALVAVDNTWMTPVLQRPLELGADLVMHSCTKYIGGHSDVMGGAVIGRRGLEVQDPETGEAGIFERLRFLKEHAGATLSPFDCWLLRRGLMTLALRVRAQCETAGRVARFLSGHPRVRWVGYPGLENDPGHAVTERQCSGFGAMLSCRVEGGFEGAQSVAGRLRLFARATSLGGVESLVEHRVRVEGPESATPADLLRFSIGLEHPDDLLADLDRALGPAAMG